MSNKNTKTRNKTGETTKKAPKAPVNDCYQPNDTLDTSNPPVDISDDAPVVEAEASKEKSPDVPAVDAEATKDKSTETPVVDIKAPKANAEKTKAKESEPKQLSADEAEELKAIEIMEANNVKTVHKVGGYWFTKHEFALQRSKETEQKIKTFTK